MLCYAPLPSGQLWPAGVAILAVGADTTRGAKTVIFRYGMAAVAATV
jgi:hypothetical protein